MAVAGVGARRVLEGYPVVVVVIERKRARTSHTTNYLSPFLRGWKDCA